MAIVTAGDVPIKEIPSLPEEVIQDIQETQKTLRPAEDEAEATSGPKEALP